MLLMGKAGRTDVVFARFRVHYGGDPGLLRQRRRRNWLHHPVSVGYNHGVNQQVTARGDLDNIPRLSFFSFSKHRTHAR